MKILASAAAGLAVLMATFWGLATGAIAQAQFDDELFSYALMHAAVIKDGDCGFLPVEEQFELFAFVARLRPVYLDMHGEETVEAAEHEALSRVTTNMPGCDGKAEEYVRMMFQVTQAQ